MRFRRALLSSIACVAACAAPEAAPIAPRAPDALHDVPPPRPIDATLDGARYVPLTLRPSEPCARGACGVEPGGGARSMADDVRIVTEPNGAILAAEQRFGHRPSHVLALPDRLGGGFLFAVPTAVREIVRAGKPPETREATRDVVWRADRWLGDAKPIYEPGLTIEAIVAGLDRVYVSARTWRAIDGVTGAPLARGPWPAAPSVRGFAALDGWRAMAIADLRGPIVTRDAGATWQAVRLPVDALDVEPSPTSRDEFAVRTAGGVIDVRADGQIAPASETIAREAATTSAGEGIEPLRAAIEDGWPLVDGTAIVARDGAAMRVRLGDGAIVDRAPRALPMAHGRCHAIPLGEGGVGFVCGEPRGDTAIYALDPRTGAMNEVRRFRAPRAIVASGNGAIAVRGACDDRDAPSTWCARSIAGAWREVRLEGASGDERVAVLRDGKVIVLTPPRGDLASARLTILDGERAASVPIDFGAFDPPLRPLLASGMWLDGIEERRPGVLGGWIEAGRSVAGYEIAIDGSARVGPLLETGAPMMSGRYALAWTEASGAHESIDGGMTWRAIDVPGPLAREREIKSRACSPVGCTAAGWLRIGWGGARAGAIDIRPPPNATHATPTVMLGCEPIGAGHVDAAHAMLDEVRAAVTGVTKGDRVTMFDARDALAPSGVARIEAWGPKSGEWDAHVARWRVRWSSAFEAGRTAHVTAPAPAPPTILDAARSTSVIPAPLTSTLATSADPSRALLLVRSATHGHAAFVLEADHAPLEIRRADGSPPPWDTDLPLGTLYADGRWYVASPSFVAGRSETVISQIDGGVVRELARVPRVREAGDGSAAPVLAWRTDGRALGLVVNGAPFGTRDSPRWVIAIDPDRGALGDVELLGATDLSDRGAPPFTVCTPADVAGHSGASNAWRFEARFDRAWNLGVRAAGTREDPTWPVVTAARVVLTPAKACVTAITAAGAFEPRARTSATPVRGTSMSVALSERERALLRCVPDTGSK